MSDLVSRLKAASFQEWQEYPSAAIGGKLAKWPVDSNLGMEAAAEITRLQKELETAREALERISSPTQTEGLLWWQVEARRALSALKDKEVAG